MKKNLIFSKSDLYLQLLILILLLTKILIFMKCDYNVSQIALLQTILVILDSVKNLLSRFTEHFTNYNEAFVDAFITRVQNDKQLIGLNTQNTQKESTQSLIQLGDQGVDLLNNMRVLIEVAYKKTPDRRDLIISNLGLTKLKNQTNKYSKHLLSSVFNTFIHTIPDYKTEIIAQGVNENKINALTTLADQYIQAATTQVINKGQSVKLTTEQQLELNDLYAEIMAICKLGQNIFKDEPEKQALFNFTAIARRYKGTRQKKTDQPVATPAPSTVPAPASEGSAASDAQNVTTTQSETSSAQTNTEENIKPSA